MNRDTEIEDGVMNWQTRDAVERCKDNEAWPIRAVFKDGYYHLSAGGRKRVLAAGLANTALANAEWPKRGRNAILWCSSARPQWTS